MSGSIRVRLAVAATLLPLLAGCTAWAPGWDSPAQWRDSTVATSSATRSGDPLERVGDAAALDRARRILEARLAADPEDRAALLDLADAHILRGAAWASGRADKRDAFQSGIQHAERAMVRNPVFRSRIEAGASVGEAAQALERADLRAMALWVTGVFYYFDEGMNPLQRVLHFDRLREARTVLERALELDPQYQAGLLPFSLAIYYIAIPGFAGRDFERSAELLDAAIAAPGTSLLPRWGRARYLHIARGDRDAFREDLEWVIGQDPARVDSRYHWNVFIQRDARALLDDIDQYF